MPCLATYFCRVSRLTGRVLRSPITTGGRVNRTSTRLGLRLWGGLYDSKRMEAHDDQVAMGGRYTAVVNILRPNHAEYKMPTRIYLADILTIVARRYGMTVKDLKRRSNEREYVVPRQVAIYVARSITHASRPKIAALLGKHQTTILHGERKIRAWHNSDPEFAALVESIISELRANHGLA